MRTCLKLLLAFIEYAATNTEILYNSISRVDSQKGKSMLAGHVFVWGVNSTEATKRIALILPPNTREWPI